MSLPRQGVPRVAIAFAVAAGSLAALGACVLPKTTDSSAGTSAATVEAGAGATAVGAYCGKDTESGATLCSAISLCPSLVIDSDAWPGCGFRVRADVLDLECACNGALCPIGIATTCADAQALLAGQTQPLVCEQVNDGRCVAAPASAAPSSCDKSCAAQCGGDPSCVQICGC